MNVSLVSMIQSTVGTISDGIWGNKTLAAVAKKLGVAVDAKSIQRAVGVTADGIIGDKTLNAIVSKLNIQAGIKAPTQTLDVFIDAGHTSDNEREYPRQFNVDWTEGKYAEIAKILGFEKNTKNSIEHLLNVALGKAAEKHLKARNLSVHFFDEPTMSNGAEINKVYTTSNAVRPRAFVSIHNNAAGMKGWDKLKSTASGSVGLYYLGRFRGKCLADIVTKSLNKTRAAYGGPNNRVETLKTSEAGVLRRADASIAAALIEVGFYDNLNDLYFMCTHIDELGESIARSVAEFLGQ